MRESEGGFSEPLDFPDDSNGYEEAAEVFLRARNPVIGAATVLEWSKRLAPGSAVLDLGCGHGVPISRVLTEQCFRVYGVDASARLIAEFRKRFPAAHAEHAPVERSEFFRRPFDAAVAWGLLFLLPAATQKALIGRVARALRPGGAFLFTSPREAVTWADALTGRISISLGRDGYEQSLRAEGFTLTGDQIDEGDNYYYFAIKGQASDVR